MKIISETVNSLDFSSRRQAQETEKTLDSVSVNIVNRLFVFFEAICRGFEKQYRDQQAKLNLEKIQWARGFMDSGINRIEQIEYGIKKCRIESPINTPTLGQFLKWCMPSPEELKIPSLEHAYEEACRNSHPANKEPNWSHQAVYHAWSMCDPYELTNSPKNQTFPIFERNYEITVKLIMRGEPMKEIPIALTHSQGAENTIAKGFEHCTSYGSARAEIARMLGL